MDLKYEYLKWKEKRKYPKYSFQKDKTGYLIYRKDLKRPVRKSLTCVRTLLEWIIKKKDENERLNQSILVYLGLPPDTSISSLDAFYKREFRKKKAIFFFKAKPQRDMKEPPRFLFEYMPEDQTSKKTSTFKDAIKTYGGKT